LKYNTEILNIQAVRALRSNNVPFAQGSNKLNYIASLALIARHKEIKFERAIKLYYLNPKPKDLIVSRLL
jgi:hypothetical protein